MRALLRGFDQLWAQRRSVAQPDVEAHDLTCIRMDEEDRGLTFESGGLGVGVDVPSLRDKLVDHKDDMLRGDVLNDVFLCSDSDPVAAQLVADEGFLHVLRGEYAFQVANRRIGDQTGFLLADDRVSRVGQKTAALVDMEFPEGGIGRAGRRRD